MRWKTILKVPLFPVAQRAVLAHRSAAGVFGPAQAGARAPAGERRAGREKCVGRSCLGELPVVLG